VPVYFFLGNSLPPEVSEGPGVEVYLKSNGLPNLCLDVDGLVSHRPLAVAS